MASTHPPITVAEEFAKMESEAEVLAPGILDLLKVYGGFDDAARQMDVYRDILHPQPHFCASSGSGQQ